MNGEVVEIEGPEGIVGTGLGIVTATDKNVTVADNNKEHKTTKGYPIFPAPEVVSAWRRAGLISK
ncbi:MAG: hypothetical protein LBU87_03155 [Lactobacillales bacterium]|jgi:hypothetical protein|nr:hypothetical protein [Lactobacillales bacterium]